MGVGKGKVVTVSYTSFDERGRLLESTADEAFSFIPGTHSLPQGLERALEGRSAGDVFRVSLAAADAYGVREEALVQKLARDQFPEAEEIAVGMVFGVETERGPQPFRVIALDDDGVTLDGNHPLAGRPIDFTIRVLEVRDASPGELRTGQPHARKR